MNSTTTSATTSATGSTNRPVVYFYRKADCHLCEDMARELVAFRREVEADLRFEIVERDIEDAPRWYERYREYVPTLVVDRREICHYFLDKDELKAALSGGGDAI